ncbi:MAG: Crp/Fnr family transcriptional regulator, partial [Bacteroidota bacterium]
AYYEQVLFNKVQFQQQLRQSNAKKAYQLFTEHYPYAAQHAPKHCIASFLGLSPYTLSRVRL